MTNTAEIAERLKGLREMMEFTTAEMAQVTGLSEDEYIAHENGERDFSVMMLVACAHKFNVDVTALFTGNTPKLSSYNLVRANQGVAVKRRHSFTYRHLAVNFRDRACEPFLVTAPYLPDSENAEIELNVHPGQEMDYVLKGSMKVLVDGKEEVLYEGDNIIYDSGKPHGMAAVGGSDCTFLAIVFGK